MISSDGRSKHEPLQLVCPLGQHLPLEHTPAPHEMPQLPQLALVLIGVSQPSASPEVVEQSAKPDVHDVCGITQAPLLHWTDAPCLTLGRAAQACPQVPQLAGSDLVSTQLDAQRSGFGATQLEAHAGTPPVVEHNPRGDAQ